jgi:phospholipase C
MGFIFPAAIFVVAACSGDTGPRGPTGATGPAGPSAGSGPDPAASFKTGTPIFGENISFDHYFATYPGGAKQPGRNGLHRTRRDERGE